MRTKQASLRQQGIALLIAVIVISIVSSIGLTLSLISSKEYKFAGTRRESQFAYYAAESGTQCALYWLTKTPDAFATADPSKKIVCRDTGAEMPINKLPFHFDLQYSGYPFYASTTITPTATNNWKVETEGHNRTGAVVRLQRSQSVEVTRLLSEVPHDVMLVVDMSASINGRGAILTRPQCTSAGVPTADPCDWINVVKAQMRLYVENDINYSIVKLGQVHFNDPATIAVHLSTDKTANSTALNSLVSTGGSNIPGGVRLARLELSKQKRTANGSPSTANTLADYRPVAEGVTPAHDRADSGITPSTDIIILITDGAPDHVVCEASSPSGWTKDDYAATTYSFPEYDNSRYVPPSPPLEVCPEGKQKKFDRNAATGGSQEALQSLAHESKKAQQNGLVVGELGAKVYVIAVNSKDEYCPAYPYSNTLGLPGSNGEIAGVPVVDPLLPPGADSIHFGKSGAVDCRDYLKKRVASPPDANETQYYYDIDDFTQLRAKLKDISDGGFDVRVVE